MVEEKQTTAQVGEVQATIHQSKIVSEKRGFRALQGLNRDES
jgi:hypothetical protein